jgi:hypothetical protein
MLGRRIASGEVFLYQVEKRATLEPNQQRLLLQTAEIVDLEITPEALAELDVEYLGAERVEALRALTGRRFDRRWRLEDALVKQGPAWRPREATPLNELYKKERRAQLGYVLEAMVVGPREESELE